MKGRSSRSNCGYAMGGAPRMRDVGGVKAPAYGSSSSVMKEAKSQTTGKVGMEGIGADGVPIKSGMAKPGRKAGGNVKSSRHVKPNKEGSDDDDDDGAAYAAGGGLKQGFISHPGALRKSLHIKAGEKIPEKKLERAEHSDNPKLRKRAILAETMKHWKH